MPNVSAMSAGAPLSAVAYVAGRGAGTLRPAAVGATRVGPVIGGAAVAALWTVAVGWANLRKCTKGKITKKEAARETASKSIGVGLAAGVGIVAVNAVRASALLAGSSALLPFLVGAAVTGGAKAAWDRKIRK